MATQQWLLGFHVLGALLFVGGAVFVGVVHTAAMRRSRPSEVAALLRLTRSGVALVGLGALASLAFGIALAEELGLDYGDAWLSAALALWTASVALGGLGGRKARHTRYLAERLAREGDRPSAELSRALAEPVSLLVNYASLAAALAVLGLMIWKPV